MSNRTPLTEAILLVLLSLAEEPRHGYAIIKDVEQMTTGRVQMSTGTLFGALQRLLEQGWIQPVEEDESPRGRRVYRLTPVGRRNLKHEFARLKDLTRIGDLRISRGGPERVGSLQTRVASLPLGTPTGIRRRDVI